MGSKRQGSRVREMERESSDLLKSRSHYLSPVGTESTLLPENDYSLRVTDRCPKTSPYRRSTLFLPKVKIVGV